MDTRERILAALFGEYSERVVLTAYEELIPRGEDGRKLRERGLGLVRIQPVHKPYYHVSRLAPVPTKNVRTGEERYIKNGLVYTRRFIETPIGRISDLVRREPAYNSPFIEEHFIKEPSDYCILEYAIRDLEYEPDYETFKRAERDLGGDGVCVAPMERTPYQRLLYEFAGVERLSIDLYNRDPDLLQLLDTIFEKQKQLAQIIAESPAQLVRIVDNITSEMIGRDRFRTYHLKGYKQLRDALRGTGKLVCVHMDGKLRGLKDEIAECPIDVVEALTPPPDGDVTVAEARKFWPDKKLWLNFTSSYHLKSPDEIRAHTRELLEQAGSYAGFVMGITEDIPESSWRKSLNAILDVLNE